MILGDTEMPEIDMRLLQLSQTGYEAFQEQFMRIYEMFEEKAFVVFRVCYLPENLEEYEFKGAYYSYYHARRVMANLNLHGFVKVFKRKVAAQNGERGYSYLEVYPTEKGRQAYENGDYCPVQATSLTWNISEENKLSADKIGIGKGYATYDYLLDKVWNPKREQLGVAQSRWYEWTKEFDLLYSSKLVTLKQEEAVKEIEVLIDHLIPTLPLRKTQARILKAVEKNCKLESFTTA